MSWDDLISSEFTKPYMLELKKFLDSEIASNAAIYPPAESVFKAFQETPFEKVKIVIIGQDPYHGEGQAEGLCFSVAKQTPIPPSLVNIYKELESDLGIFRPKHGSLISWAKQGVLLLNATLTVRANEPKSHFGKGWEMFTDKVVQVLCERKDPLVFMLWGKSAIDKFKNVQGMRDSHHLVLTAPHPSPFSAHTGFLGCRHFSKANQFLKAHNQVEIDWNIFD